MANTILTLDEINLLKHSEELKNQQVYGNLYQVLMDLQNPKAVSLEQLLGLDDTAKGALTYNKPTLMDTVIKEWYAERVIEEDSSKNIKCGLCNTPNKYLYFIRNRLNDETLNVGSSCIKKFPGIEGYTERSKQLKDIVSNRKQAQRRTEFNKRFENVENIIFAAERYFPSIPILLPITIYTELKETISSMRLIYSSYVNKGTTPYKTDIHSFELFDSKLKKYQELKLQAEDFVSKNIDEFLICERKEVNWMLENKKEDLLMEIALNNGKYTEKTAGSIYSKDFIDKYKYFFSARNKSTRFRIAEFNGDRREVIFKTTPIVGFNPPIIFKISYESFMRIFGSKCLFNDEYYYTTEDILNKCKIVISQDNLISIVNLVNSLIHHLGYVFIIDYTMNKPYLYRKTDGAIRAFETNQLLQNFVPYVTQNSEEVKKYILLVVKSRRAKWISKEQQIKQDTYDKTFRMYKNQYLDIKNQLDENIGFSKEIPVYIQNKKQFQQDYKINYDTLEIISIPKHCVRDQGIKIKDVSFAVKFTEKILIPGYEDADLIVFQNTKTLNDGDIGLFTFHGKQYLLKYNILGDNKKDLEMLEPEVDIPFFEYSQEIVFAKVLCGIKIIENVVTVVKDSISV